MDTLAARPSTSVAIGTGPRATRGEARSPHVGALWPGAELLSEDTPSGWRGALLRMGRTRAVLVITSASVLMSLLVTMLVSFATGDGTRLAVNLLVAAFVPLVVAPLASGGALGLLVEVEAARRLLREAAIRDGLTNLYNRRFFAARLQAEIAAARLAARPLAVILIDIDHFKRVNDLWGHAAGDEVLQRVADALLAFVRPDDLSARFGGEEFVALLPGATLAEARTVAEDIRRGIESLRIPAFGAAPAPHVTASLGIACLGAGVESDDGLLRRADDAMYEAKAAGRNCCVVAPA